MKRAALIASILLLAGCTPLSLERVNAASNTGTICAPRWNVDSNQQVWACGDSAMNTISPLVFTEVTDAY